MSLLTSLEKNTNNSFVDFNVFPSINSGAFQIESNEASGAALTIIDVSGKYVYTGSLIENKTAFDLSLLPGIYFIKLETKSGMGVKKIIVE